MESTIVTKGKTSLKSKIIATAIIIILIALIVSMCSDEGIDPSDMTKEQQDSIKHQEWIIKQFSAWDGSHTLTVKKIKENMNDPNSFEHIQTTYVDFGKTLVITTVFTGKNAFGGRVKQTVVSDIDSTGNIVDFNLIE